jgi:hypothetical protein
MTNYITNDEILIENALFFAAEEEKHSLPKKLEKHSERIPYPW